MRIGGTGHSPLGPRCRTSRTPDARRTRVDDSTRRHACGLAFNRERRLPFSMEQSMQGHTFKGFVATDATASLSQQSSRATIEAQMLVQRRRNASATVRAYQKFTRERRNGLRPDFR
jgi:hypothetical protein